MEEPPTHLDYDDIEILIEAGRKKKARLQTSQHLKQKHDFITLQDNQTLMIYQNGYYHNSALPTVNQEVNQLWREHTSSHDTKEIIEAHLKPTTYITREELNPGTKTLPVKNGLLNLETRELQPHTPKEKYTFKIPTPYKPDIDTTPAKEYIQEIVGEDQVPIIQEMIGYCLLRDYPYNRAFMLFGSGSNGKTTFVNFLIQLLGEDNISTKGLHDLLYNRFAKKHLYGKLACIHDDLPNKELNGTGTFKMLTGRGRIDADVKFKEGFEFRNHAKLIFTANELPKTTDTTEAFFRRWIIIDFPHHFTEEDRDPDILERITTQDFLSAALKWSLDGLDRIFENNGFTTTDTIRDTKSRWIMESDPLRGFLERYVEYDSESFITKDELHRRLNKWCDEHDFANITKQYVGQHLPSILHKVRAEKKTIDGRQERVWRGVKWIGEDSGGLDRKDSYPSLSNYSNIINSSRVSILKSLDNCLDCTSDIKNPRLQKGSGSVLREKVKDILGDIRDFDPCLRDAFDQEGEPEIIDKLLQDGLVFEPRRGVLDLTDRGREFLDGEEKRRVG